MAIFMNETKKPIIGFSYVKVSEEIICRVGSRLGPRLLLLFHVHKLVLRNFASSHN
jgi:hypothetical protein